MYLVAIKSLYSRIGEGRICIINDGTITPASMNLLKEHLSTPEIIHISDITTGKCPYGGTWERLLKILDLSRDAYVIQVDSDTLVRTLVPEVTELYRKNSSFTLGSWAGQRFVNILDAADYAANIDSNHIQIVSERMLAHLDGASRKQYVRGCSGFAGFARGAVSRTQAETFSIAMEALVGSRWSEWGSEQVTSNYLIANAPNSHVLPLPSYVNFKPDLCIADAKLIHFIGDYRFHRARYVQESRRLIRELGMIG